VFLLGLWLAWLVTERQPAVAGAAVAILVLLGVALALGSSYPRPEFRTLGQAPDEQAVLFMRQQLAPEARVAAVAPCQVWTAGGSYVPISFEQRAITTGEEMVEWLAEKRVTAIYVDDRLRNREPATFRLIDGLIGQGLEVGISNGNVQVLMVDTSP